MEERSEEKEKKRKREEKARENKRKKRKHEKTRENKGKQEKTRENKRKQEKAREKNQWRTVFEGKTEGRKGSNFHSNFFDTFVFKVTSPLLVFFCFCFSFLLSPD